MSFDIDFARNPAELPVNVSLPTSVLSDLDAFNRVQESVLRLLGCENCSSGFSIKYLAQRSFHVSPDLEVTPFQNPGF
jgi:hypothetical protein